MGDDMDNEMGNDMDDEIDNEYTPSEGFEDEITPAMSELLATKGVMNMDPDNFQVPSFGQTVVMCNTTRYNVFAIKGDSAYAGYRVMESGVVKFMIVGRQGKAVQGSYRSSVRPAQSAVVRTMFEGSYTEPSKFEASSFVIFIRRTFEKYGFEVSLSNIGTDIENSAKSQDSRRKLDFEFTV